MQTLVSRHFQLQFTILFIFAGEARNMAPANQRLPATDRWPGQRLPEGGDAQVDQHEVHLQGQGHPTPPTPCRTPGHQRG